MDKKFWAIVLYLFAVMSGNAQCPLNINKCDLAEWEHPEKIVMVKILDIVNTPADEPALEHFGETPIRHLIMAEYNNKKIVLTGVDSIAFSRANEATEIEIGKQYLVVLYGPLIMRWTYFAGAEMYLNWVGWTNKDRKILRRFVHKSWYRCLNMQGNLMYPITEAVRLTSECENLIKQENIHIQDVYNQHPGEEGDPYPNTVFSNPRNKANIEARLKRKASDSTKHVESKEESAWRHLRDTWGYKLPPLDSIQIIRH